MIIGPKYKIARRLGADLFEKTQTQKFAMRSGRGGKEMAKGYNRSNFGIQLKEKQRARMLYGIGEKQFARYVREAVAKKTLRDDEALFQTLELRLDNVAYRLGIAPTRQAARQLTAHGHLLVNGVRVTIPSYRVSVGDVIAIRKASEKKPLFLGLSDKIRDHVSPIWVRFDLVKSSATVVGAPKLVKNELPFNIASILEFYRQ